jgi:hypothetical protein
MQAVADLKTEMGLDGTVFTPTTPPPPVGTDEGWVQSVVRLEAGRLRIPLWRNNVGALQDKDDRWVRYGLANDSKAVNDRIKSADLIGIRPLVIGHDMVGHTVGQFVSREVKPPGWHYTGTDREAAQLRWLELVKANGGDACFVTGAGSL